MGIVIGIVLNLQIALGYQMVKFCIVLLLFYKQEIQVQRIVLHSQTITILAVVISPFRQSILKTFSIPVHEYGMLQFVLQLVVPPPFYTIPEQLFRRRHVCMFSRQPAGPVGDVSQCSPGSQYSKKSDAQSEPPQRQAL